ncbi:hypothetical protein [Natrialba asiatica]|uniref:Uncharacterized protein n=1 Tax=Natrialba asiatica (strain ATCC 700177 / DSM 12278 / JCM 9576 / FERM P-10747 / NBRC 102637 / 172P1) TaxID=29540 RepID=M0B4X5_NATA1|nr:hypothetical protein [Natrialba asiatica]ELZ05557.1 hypothetical protein C481_02522 [Natrialba asiatica DSM 12278]
MTPGTQSDANRKSEPTPTGRPEIEVCQSGPDKSVFIESGNTDGWISSTVLVDVIQ